AVDSELLLLVDVSIPGLSDTNFDDLMQNYASAFSAPDTLSAIQSGQEGRIAVSMMFFGNSVTQQVGIPWMMIGSSTDADAFANLASNVNRPFSFGFSDPGAALDVATPYFGTETGGVSNGFESEVQIVEVAASGVAFPFNAADTQASSDSALASGVDVMNSISLGFFGGLSENYYEQNVIGSSLEGVEATSETSGVGAGLASVVTENIEVSVQNGAQASISAVPEPSSLVIAMSFPGVLLLRRRR
ncbi:MAG: DUF1194 domain-containing protein, partial [Verrucomicrobiota bacterium]